MGITFVYLGLIEKLADPGRALLVVEKYDLTSVVPVDPGLWVVGAGVTEIAVGLALIAGFFTRGAAALSFVLFTATLFGLPDDPVLAHVALFGMASAVFTLGSGPLSFDRLVGRPALTTTTRRSSRPTEVEGGDRSGRLDDRVAGAHGRIAEWPRRTLLRNH